MQGKQAIEEGTEVELTQGLVPEMGSNEVEIISRAVSGQDNMEIMDGGAVEGVRDQEGGGRISDEAGEVEQNTVASFFCWCF